MTESNINQTSKNRQKLSNSLSKQNMGINRHLKSQSRP